MAVEFNRQLKERVIKLRTELPEAAVTYVDVYATKYDLIGNAKTLGNHFILNCNCHSLICLRSQ